MEKKRNRFDSRSPRPSTTPRLIRLIVGLGLVLVFMYMAWQKAQEGPRNLGGPPAVKVNQPADPESSAGKTPRVHVEPERVIQTQIKEATIRNQDGKVVYRGDIDLRDTLARIERNERGDHGNDGSVFQNREQRLPQKPAGYYREWVHPTEGLRGPGPQRIVTGEDGEIYYTPDHYETFLRLDSEEGTKE
jgi:guanyl-specific ribonuclease Sa